MHVEVLEVLDDIDYQKILEEANSVKMALGKGWRDIDQVGIQGHKPNLDPLEEWDKSIGYPIVDGKSGYPGQIKYPETYFKYPLFDIPTINRCLDKYGLKRTRIMKSNSKSCLKLHSDLTKRIHIPLISNPDCFMMIDDQVYYLEPGKIYLTNTTLKHTAVNASSSFRVHIVGCLYS